MSQAAFLHYTARLLERITPDQPADFVLRRQLAEDAALTPEDKRAVAGAVFAYYRWFGWLDLKASFSSRLASALDLQQKFETKPDLIKTEAIAARAFPSWIHDELTFSPADLRQLQSPPVLWLRAQAEFAPSLPRSLPGCEPAPPSPFLPAAHAPTALRYTGPKDLFRTDEFKQGLFEIQDLTSQLVGHACTPQPGQTWWDACAGEGGKTLHLTDLMQNRGLIWATDRHTGRLARLRKRAARAKAYNYRAAVWNGGPVLPTKTKFDGILLDAPCSGVGTWQRNPHARWTTTPDDVRELAEIQLQLLRHVVPALKSGARLIYAVCTLTRSETTAVVDAFETEHPHLQPVPVFPSAPSPRQFISPSSHSANGMFVATWQTP